MDFNLFDTPMIRQILFYPRKANPMPTPCDNIVDGTMAVDEDVVLGYRLFKNSDLNAPLLLYFHGNGEIAPDYTHFAHEFLNLGLNLVVMDYRGYGWSTGEPRVKYLIEDAEKIMAALPAFKIEHGLTSAKLIVFGRSLGSTPATHTAYKFPEQVSGLVIESGFAQLPPLMARLGLPVQWQANLPDPIGNLRKMTEVQCPVLIIHGERDTLIPIANGEKMHEAAPSENKKLVRLAGVGHNDLLLRIDEYFGALRGFLNSLD